MMTYPDQLIADLETRLIEDDPAVASAALALINVTVGFEADHSDWLYVFLLACESIDRALAAADSTHRTYVWGCIESAGIGHLFNDEALYQDQHV
jgi:hypothetical protein